MMDQKHRILLALFFVSQILPACADQIHSSEETSVTTGVGVRGANKFNFKYKERLNTYEHQIKLGLEKGWLAKEDAEKFSTRLEALKVVEQEVSAKGYQRADVDALELKVTEFNKDFSDAGQKKSKPSPSSSPTPKSVAENTTKPNTSTSTKTSAKASVSTKKMTTKKATAKKK